jgi:hypothetical protein
MEEVCCGHYFSNLISRNTRDEGRVLQLVSCNIMERREKHFCSSLVGLPIQYTVKRVIILR